jgi:hypothetical protein
MASKEISKFHLDNFKTLAKHILKFTSFSVKQIVNSIIFNKILLGVVFNKEDRFL